MVAENKNVCSQRKRNVWSQENVSAENKVNRMFGCRAKFPQKIRVFGEEENGMVGRRETFWQKIRMFGGQENRMRGRRGTFWQKIRVF